MEFYPDEAARTRVRRATTVRCTVETVCIFKKQTLILVKIHAVARSSGVSIFGCYQEPGTEGKVSGFVCSNYEICNSTANVFAWTNVSIVLRSSQLKAIESAADQPTSTSASVSSAFTTTSTLTSSTARSVGYTTSQMAGSTQVSAFRYLQRLSQCLCYSSLSGRDPGRVAPSWSDSLQYKSVDRSQSLNQKQHIVPLHEPNTDGGVQELSGDLLRVRGARDYLVESLEERHNSQGFIVLALEQLSNSYESFSILFRSKCEA